jgi:hypothetical protein
VLNRLFILVGSIAILALAAAFVVPGFVDWTYLRDRMQTLASETLGAPVTISGDIDVAFLPEPRVQFAGVSVGTPERPVMTVVGVEARFSLADLFRDHYTLTRLVLTQPAIELRLDADGQLDTGVTLGETVTGSVVSVPSAQIVDGSVRVVDARTGDAQVATAVSGDLRLETVRGPYGFQGKGTVGGAGYTLRVATSALSDEGPTTVSVFTQPDSQAFTLSAEGALSLDGRPEFNGKATYRQRPAAAADGTPPDIGRGDLVVEGSLAINPDRLVLANYSAVLDENRAASRLTGAFGVTLGASPTFNLVVEGSTFALPPRDMTADSGVSPYELVRLLNEIGLPPVPSIPGTVGLSLSEADLRAVVLRNVRVDATAREGVWQIDGFSAVLPGNSALEVSGTLSQRAGRPSFSGDMSLASSRLDALVQLWRRPPADNPLSGLRGEYAAQVALVGETLSLSSGRLLLDGSEHALAAEIGFGSTSRHLNVRAQFAVLTPRQSAALAALLPDAGQGGAFALTFPRGNFDIRLPSATVFGLSGTNLSAEGSWEGGVIAVDDLSADDLGGVSLEARLTAFGSLERPEVSGTADVTVLSAQAPALAAMFDLLQAPPTVREYLGNWLPARLSLRLDAPSGAGGQEVAVTGRAGAADVRLDARVDAGFLRALSGPLSLSLDLLAEDAVAMSRQLGFGENTLTPDDLPMHAVAIVEGTPTNSLETTLLVEGGPDSLAFSGNVVVSNPNLLTGNGTLKASLTDLSALTGALGAGGIGVPRVSGSAHLEFTGTSRVTIDQISATSGGQQFSGSLDLVEAAGQRTVSGALQIGRFAPADLLALLGGRQALLSLAEGIWPDGPLATGEAPRTTTGRVSIAAPAIVVGEREVVTDVGFELDWDATTTRIRRLNGTIGGGSVSLDAAICCAGPITAKQLTGRLALSDVGIDAVAPDAIAAGLDGTLDASAQFDATGIDLAELLQGMTGQGSYAVRGLRIAGLAPDAFARAGALKDLLESDGLVLTATLVDQFDDGVLEAADVQGSFTIAGGVLRSPNLPIAGNGLRLFGNLSVALPTLVLSGGFAMTPTVAPAGDLLSEAMAQINVNLSGTLLEPIRTFDAAGMVEAMQARALEAEVERLEQLRAEDEARQREAAEERARIAAEQAAQEAAAAAEREAAEAAARQRAEEEAARRRAEEQQQEEQQTDIVGPLDLGL